MEDGVFHPTEAGTPQGGVISPLLANIALHGMEKALGVKYDNRGQICGNRAVVRYADDFVVFCESKEDAEVSVQILTEWLAKRGLTLSPEKTRIVHITEGFDFLGFNVKQYKVNNTRTGYKLLIRPSKESVKNIRRKLRTHWKNLKGTNVIAVLKTLNPIIRGEANYYRIAVATRTFSSLDDWMTKRAVRYAKSTHPTKPWKWLVKKYWGRLNKERKNNWVFGDKQTGGYLLKFTWFNIKRHVLVKGPASPDDPNLQAYWVNRTKGKSAELSATEQRLARKQNYVCPLCGQSLFNDEELHIHHVQPRRKGGTNADENRKIVHLYCHQQIHSSQGVKTDATGQPLLL